MFTRAFLKGAAERAIKTWFQTFAAMLALSVGTDLIPSVGVEGVSWVAILSGATVAAVLSVATSVGNADFTAGQKPVVIEHDAPTTVVNVAPAERTVDLDEPRPRRIP